MQNVFTDRVLPIMRHWDKILGGGGGGGGSPCSPNIMVAYVFILFSSRFCPSLTGLAVCARVQGHS